MTRAEFSSALKDLGMNRSGFAAFVGIHKHTVYHWGADGTPFPVWVPVLLRQLQENMRLSHKISCLTKT